MRRITRTGFALLTIAFLGVAIGCGGSSGGGESTTTTTPTPPAQTGPASGSEFLYGYDSTFGRLYASSLSPASGQLTQPIDVTPVTLPRPVAVSPQFPPIASPSGKSLYHLGYDQPSFLDAIFPLSISGTKGELTAITSSYPYDFVQGHLNGFAMDGTGKFLFVGYDDELDKHWIAQFAIDQNTGVIKGINSPYQERSQIGSFSLQAADPSGKYLYALVNSQSGLEIFAYAINTSTGELSGIAGSPYVVSQFASFGYLHPHPSGKFVYVSTAAQNADYSTAQLLYIFSIDSSGALHPAGDSPYQIAGGQAVDFSFSPNGNFVYLAQRSLDNSGNVTGSIGEFSVNQSDGSVSANPVSSISTLCTNFFPDPSGNVLLIGPCGDNHATFWSYVIDKSTGVLTQAQGSPFFVNNGILQQYFTIARVP